MPGISLHSGRSQDCSNGTLVHKSSSEIDMFSDDSPEDVNEMFPLSNNPPMLDQLDAPHDTPPVHLLDAPAGSPAHYTDNRSRSVVSGIGLNFVLVIYRFN